MGIATLERRIKYSALDSQRKFHQLTTRFKGFSGPVGSGKSQALCQEAIRLSYLNPGRTGLIGAPTYPMLRDATVTALTETLIENEIPYELNKSEFVLVLKDNGSRILLRAIEEFERLRGTNLAWFGLDELTYAQEGAWLRLVARLRDPKAARHCGFAVWTPKGFDWVYRRFVQNPVNGYGAVQAKPYENRFLLKHTPDFYERLKDSYDEQFFRQEVLGQYVNAKGGLVYQAFSREANVQVTEVDPSRCVYWAVDFNVDPMSSVVAQEQAGTIWVLDEIVLRRATTQQACETFAERFGKLEAGVVVYGDASGGTMQTTGFSDYRVITDFFKQRGMNASYRVPSKNPPVRSRVLAVNSKLRSAEGDIRLFVDPKCKELIADFEQVAFEEDSTEIDKKKDRRRTHLSDALGYLIWQECKGGPIGEQGRPLF